MHNIKYCDITLLGITYSTVIKYCDITLLGITYSTVIKRNCAVTRNCLFDYKLLEDLAIAT